MDRPIVPIEAFNLVPADADKHARHWLSKFQDWMTARGRAWHIPDLKAYRDAMLIDGKAPATVSAYLATVRGRSSGILRDNGAREALHGLASRTLQETEQADTPANRKAFLHETTTRLKNVTDLRSILVKAETHQDHPDSEHLRQTAEQAPALMAAPGLEMRK